MKFPLKKPITANGEQVSELELREPETKELIELGMPISFNGEGSSDIKMHIVAKYISRLAGIPPSSVEEISRADLIKLALEVVDFFNEPEST